MTGPTQRIVQVAGPAEAHGDRAVCRSCKAPIIWMRTTRDRRMPLDPGPNAEDGNVRIIEHGDLLGRAEVLGPLEAQLARANDEPVYVPHFATCPQGDRWSRT